MNRTESLDMTGEQVLRKGEELANKASEKARETAERVGERISGASDTIQGKLRETGEEVASAVSEKVSSSAQYFEDSSVQDVVEDVTILIKRHPIYAALIGAGIAFLLARGRSR